MGLETAALIGIAGAATGAAGTVGSFIQAGQQRELQQRAEKEAEKALKEAEKNLDINYYSKLGIEKLPYELQSEAALASGAQLIEAAQESGRGASEVAGRVQMAQNEQQRQISADMAQEMSKLGLISAQEDARLAKEKSDLYQKESIGAQTAAAYYDQAENKAITNGLNSFGMFAGGVAQALPLYPSAQTQIDKTPQYTGPMSANAAPYIPPTPPANSEKSPYYGNYLTSNAWQLYGLSPEQQQAVIQQNNGLVKSPYRY